MSIPHIADYTLPGRADLPANKASWRPNPDRAVLLLHDLQDYFLQHFRRDPARSACGVVSEQSEVARMMLRTAASLRTACRRRGVPVYYSVQEPARSAEERGLLRDLWGTGLAAAPELKSIAREVAPSETDVVFIKHRYSALHRTPLLSSLRASGRDQLWICGIYAHIGCLLTACEAFMNDVQPFFVADGVADFSLAHHRMAIEYVASRCGVALLGTDLLSALDSPSAAEPRSVQRPSLQPELEP